MLEKCKALEKAVDKGILVAMAKVLPEGAQLGGYDGSCKSYTLHGDDGTSKISVLVDKETFYVWPVEEMPTCFEGNFKINKRDRFFFNSCMKCNCSCTSRLPVPL